MKKSTGIVFVVLILLGLWAYFREWRGHAPTDTSDTSNSVTMAFKVDETQINHIELTKDGKTMAFDRKDDGWYVTSPVMTRADQSAVGAIAHTISELPSDRSLPSPTAQQIQDWGLDKPTMTIVIGLQNGTKHTMVIGGKDFSGLEVYSRLDGSKTVTLVSNVTANAADKPFDEFRDHTVLLFPSQYDVTAFDLKNASGTISVKKDAGQWDIVKPVQTPADYGAIATLLGNAGTGKIAAFVSDDAKNVPPTTLAQYGLTNPALRLDLTIVGGKSEDLLIGKKDGLEAYAMDTSRNMIFRVPQAFYNKLNQQKLDNLRAKALFSGNDSDITQLQVQASKGAATTCVRQENGNLVIQQPSGKSGQAPDCPDFLSPLEHVQARRVEDQPSADARARLAKPAIVVTLTEAISPAEANPGSPVSVGNPAGQSTAPRKTLEIQISAPAGNVVYARTSAGPAVYEFDKGAFDALNAKPADTASASAQSPAKPQQTK